MFVSVKVCDFICPSVTLPYAKLVGVRLNAGCALEAVSEIVNGELVASLVTVTFPVTLPPAVGANTTFRSTVAVAGSVKGVVIPLTLNPAPVAAMLDIWTAAVPVLLKLICFVTLLPAFTLPNANDVGFACSCPNVADEPAPPKVTVVVGLAGSLLVIVRTPDAEPAVVG